MKTNNKIAAGIGVAIICLIFYYFLLPDRDWMGKPCLEAQSPEGFAVVELFTSEGCSSCPPADALLAKFRKDIGSQKIYCLAYHVDYWDNQGWKDKFSLFEYTIRQQDYANWMRKELIYTPQFIINGTSEFGGDDARNLYSSVSNALDKKPESTLVLRAAAIDNIIAVEYTCGNVGTDNNLSIAVVQKDASTNIKRGENQGRVLHHVQIVRQLFTTPLFNKDGSVIVSKPEGFNTTDWEVIGFIQNKSTGTIRAAARVDF